VWLGWFLAKTLADFAPLAAERGDTARVAWCASEIERLAQVIDAHGWDGSWYRRAYFDDGAALGTHQDFECRIDAIAQSWAVIAGIGDKSRAALALAKSEELLIREEPRTMLLLWPPFEHTPRDPGYIKAYPAGVRENGGQYTHGVLWTLQALARSGEGDRAGRLLSLLNPIQHARTREDCLRYRVEPYVVAADVYSAPGHEGRGGWTWYTGAAGWMYRVVLESVLGFTRRGDLLSISPCVPRAWQRFEIEYRHGQSLFTIRVDNPQGVMSGVRKIELDGELVADPVRLDGSGGVHTIRVVMGTILPGRTVASLSDSSTQPPHSAHSRASS
jgi:cyclic beta-1,2-glucan synthetase